MISRARLAVLIALASLFAIGGKCSDGDGGSVGCDGSCAQTALSVADVERIVAQAAAEASFAGVSATIAVVDRVGNVLAVFAMAGAPGTTTITTGRGVTTGLEGLVVPSTLVAISKAGTAAYLSSQGNAFSTRTASQIIQENFNPGEVGRAGGPLFGLQFSQLPCGDLVRRFSEDMREGLTAVVSIKISNPQFEGQNKGRLLNAEVAGWVEQMINEAPSAWGVGGSGRPASLRRRRSGGRRGNRVRRRLHHRPGRPG